MGRPCSEGPAIGRCRLIAPRTWEQGLDGGFVGCRLCVSRPAGRHSVDGSEHDGCHQPRLASVRRRTGRGRLHGSWESCGSVGLHGSRLQAAPPEVVGPSRRAGRQAPAAEQPIHRPHTHPVGEGHRLQLHRPDLGHCSQAPFPQAGHKRGGAGQAASREEHPGGDTERRAILGDGSDLARRLCGSGGGGLLGECAAAGSRSSPAAALSPF